MKKAYLIKNIEEYGKLMAFCIDKDICVFRTFWNECEKGKRCFNIDWKEKRCYYSNIEYYIREGYEILEPIFEIDKYGENFVLISKPRV